jgi:hypothetical protein
MIRFVLLLVVLPFSCLGASAEIAFSPHGGATDLVVRTIASAHHTVRVAAYSFTSKPIALALLADARRDEHVDLMRWRCTP